MGTACSSRNTKESSVHFGSVATSGSVGSGLSYKGEMDMTVMLNYSSTPSARTATTARCAASCSDFFPAKTWRLGVAGPQEAAPGAGACLVIGRLSGGKLERGWGAPPPLSTPPPLPSGPRPRPALRALLGSPSVQRGRWRDLGPLIMGALHET